MLHSTLNQGLKGPSDRRLDDVKMDRSRTVRYLAGIAGATVDVFQSLRRGFVSATRRLSKPTKRLHLFDPRANPLAHRFWFQYSYRTNGAEWLRRGNERTVCVLGRPSLQRVVHLRTTTQSTRL